MTVTIQIDVPEHPTRHVYATDAQLDEVRFTFNPSLNDDVTVLKALAAAFLAKCDYIAYHNPSAGRETAVAKTNMQTASMWAVLGATKVMKD